jgi:hypothetical protein
VNVCGDDVVTLEHYLDLITNTHNHQPRYMATVALSIVPYVRMLNDALCLRRIFDVDTAVGQQLDFIGEWVGISRFIDIPLDIWLSFDTPGLGWNQGQWHVDYESSVQHVRLDDEHYRILLKARIQANHWDGTHPGAYSAWDELFDTWGYRVLIEDGYYRKNPCDLDLWFSWDIDGKGWDEGYWLWIPRYPDAVLNGNMHVEQILVGPPLSPVIFALFVGGYLDLKSAAVSTSYVIQTQPVHPDDGQSGVGAPLFAWDIGPDGTDPSHDAYPPTTLAGWDMGGWARVVQPGEAWIPEPPEPVSHQLEHA